MQNTNTQMQNAKYKIQNNDSGNIICMNPVWIQIQN